MRILNAEGKPILLNALEKKRAEHFQKMCNDLGYEINITTLTTIIKKVSEQKFFEIAPADFIPVVVGEGAFGSVLTTYRSFAIGGDFATGIINNGSNNGRLAAADAGVDAVSIKINNWGKSIGWTIFELEQASKSGNWDIVTSKERSRKKNWDLGIQQVAFLGLEGDSAVKGLLNQTGVTANTTLITEAIKDMTATELKAFVSDVLDTYRANCSRTVWPTHFVIPESDYLGLAAPSNPDYPLKSSLQILEETFQTMTKNKNFQILPLAYADAAYNGLDLQKYALYNADEESLRMDIPVDYTTTLANSTDNFSFQNVGYGQFTGVQVVRPAELMYFQYDPTP